MTTIFTLTEITVNSKSRYPVRKTQERDLGLYSTLTNAEAEMKRQAQLELEAEREYRKEIAEDEECRQDEKLRGHNVVLAFRIIERELDAPSWGDIQSVRTYTATGDPNDECLLDDMCERHFTGRQPEKIRFHPGDIVEVITSWDAELCVVSKTPPTEDDYKRLLPYWQENAIKRCAGNGVEYEETYCFHWDYSDDCYLAYSLGEGDTHSHPESPKVFRPTKPVPKALRDRLKAKYEEMRKRYGQ